MGDTNCLFRIKDFRNRGELREFKNKQTFVAELERLITANTDGSSPTVTKYSIYESKLGLVPAPLMHVKKMPKGMKLRHEYVSFEVTVHNDPICFVSMDKGTSGILTQISCSESRIAEWCMNKKMTAPEKRNRLGLLKKVDMTNIRFLTKNQPPTVTEFLSEFLLADKDNVDITPNYDLITSNCQLFAHDVTGRIDHIAKSREIRFCLPGLGGERVTIDDPSIPTHLQKMYPSLIKGALVEMPETSEKFMLVNDEVNARSESIAQPEIDFLQWKQRVYGFVKSWLERRRDQSNGWQVIFSNLTGERVEKALDSSQMVRRDVRTLASAETPDSYTTTIKEFWREAFDILIIAPSVGYTIIRLEDEEPMEVNDGAMHDQADMLAELGDIDVSEIAQETFWMSNSSDDAEKRVDEFLNSRASAKKINHIQAISKLILLNRLEEDIVLLHNKFEEQIWGNAAMFTEEQYTVISRAQQAFREGKPTHMLVKGPPGAGKTLVLMKHARDFVSIVRDERKKVFISIEPKYTMLINHLKSVVVKDEQMRGRVILADAESIEKYKGDKSNIALILVDEADLIRITQFYKTILPHQSAIVFSSNLLFSLEDLSQSMHDEVRDEFRWQEFALSVSLRATKKVSEFVAGFQKVSDSGRFQLEVLSGVAVDGTDVERIQVTEPWGKDQKFLTETVEQLKKLNRKFVPSEQPTEKPSPDTAEVVLILVRGHHIFKEAIKAKLKEEGVGEKFAFAEDAEVSDSILGCQWPAVAIVVDGSSYVINRRWKSLLNVLTRATSHVILIYHKSDKTMPVTPQINSFRLVRTNKKDLEAHLKSLAKKSSPRILIDDRAGEVKPETRQELKSTCDFTKFDQNVNEELENVSLVVKIVDFMSSGGLSTALVAKVPVVEFIVGTGFGAPGVQDFYNLLDSCSATKTKFDE